MIGMRWVAWVLACAVGTVAVLQKAPSRPDGAGSEPPISRAAQPRPSAMPRPPRTQIAASQPAQALADPTAPLRQRAVLSLGSPVDAVAIGDVSGDGLNDIVASTHQNEAGSGASTAGDFKVSVFVQLPDGTLAAPLQASFPGFLMHSPNKSLALVDLNEDGLRDIVLAYGEGLYVYEGAATGQLIGRPVPNLSGGCHTLATLDVNGDGHADIAAFDGFRVRMLLGDGQGALTHSYTFSTSPVGLHNLNSHMAPGDLNGDGRTDLAFYDGTNQGAIYVQTAGGAFERWPYSFSPYPAVYFTAMAVADFDADGDQDFMLATRQTERTRPLARHDLYRQSGGQLLPRLNWGLYEVASAMIGADIDGDGRQDLIAVRSPSDVNAWVGYSRQKPEGGFDAEIQIPLSRMIYSTSPRNLAAGDFTGDGCTDIAVGNGREVTLLQAQCELPMTTGGRLPAELRGTGSPAAAAALRVPATPSAAVGNARWPAHAGFDPRQLGERAER